MTELRFHRELYRGEAVDEAVRVFGRFAGLERADEPMHWVVRVSPTTADERTVAGELRNYVLGLTVRQRGGS